MNVTWVWGEFWSKIYQEKAARSQQNRLFVAEMGENLEMGETTKCHERPQNRQNLSASLRQHNGESWGGPSLDLSNELQGQDQIDTKAMSSIVCASQCCKVFGKNVKNLNRSEFIMMISSLLTTRLFLQISATCFCKQLWISLMMDHPRHSILKRKHRNYGTKIETGLEVHYIAFDAVKKSFEKADIKHCGNSNCLMVTSCSKIFKHLYGWTQLPSIAHLQHSSSELSSLSESEISWCVS